MSILGRLQEGKLKIAGELVLKDDTTVAPTFARNSVAYWNGVQYLANAPRFAEGLILEEATTNLFPTGSGDFHNAGNTTGWYPNGGAVPNITGGQLDPYGGTKAYRIQTTGGSSLAKYNLYKTGLTIGATVSVWVKLNSGSAKVQDDFGGNPASLVLTSNWQKFIYQTTTSSCKLTFATLAIADTLDIIATEPQLEQKSYPTSHIEPSVIRPQEQLTIPASVLSYEESTIEFDYTPINQPLSDMTAQNKSPKIMQIGTYFAANSLTLWRFPYSGLDYIRLLGNYISAWKLIAVYSYTFNLNTKIRIALRWKTANTFDVLINGVTIIQNAISTIPFTAMGNIILGDTVASGGVNAIYSNVRVSNKWRTDTELANTGALVNDEFTTYYAPFHSDLYATSGEFQPLRLTPSGNVEVTGDIIEQPDIPSDVYYFPLTFDGKDISHVYLPSAETNLVYSNEGVWIGSATQNYYTGYTPLSINGGTVEDVSLSFGEYGFLNNGAKTWKFGRDGTTDQFHGWQGTYNNWISGVNGAFFTSSGYYKSADKAGVDSLNAFIPYLQDFSLPVGQNISSSGLTVIDDNKWNYYTSTCMLTQDYNGALAQFPWTDSSLAGTAYYHAQMWEKKPFPSPFCASTRGAGLLTYNLHDSLGLDWNGDWTVCYWRKPVGTNTNTLTGYNIDSLGCGGNSVGGGYMWWGKNSNVDTIYADSVLVSSFSNYFNKWHMISFTKSGTTGTIKFWGIDGNVLVRTVTYGTSYPSNYYVTQFGYDLQLGGFNGENPCNSYFKDLVVAKRALTDNELSALYRTQMKSYNNGILLIRDGISENNKF